MKNRVTSWILVLQIFCISDAIAQSTTYAKKGSVATDTPRESKLTRLPPSPEVLSALKKPITLKTEGIPLQEVLAEISAKGGFQLSYSKDLVPVDKRISLDVEDVPAVEALRAVLAGTDHDYTVEGNFVVLVRRSLVEEETGTVVGRVSDARSKKGLPGANVVIVGTRFVAATDAEGNYRIERVPPGKYEVRASVVGYGKVGKTVTVNAGETSSADFFLDEEAIGLDEVVVTGVYGETRRREIPADIAVMTSKQIAEKNASNITDVLKGEIPGVFAQNNGQFDYKSNIYLRGTAFFNPDLGGPFAFQSDEVAKIYLDGIELSKSTLLSTIDPSSIERIEVVRGPHAVALYGAQASAGVIQIMTKKGAPTGLERPQINASFSAGYVQSHFLGKELTSSGVTPLETNSTVEMMGGKQTLSYRAGVSYATIGEWMQNYRSKTISLSGGLRVIEGPVTAELTSLFSNRGYHRPSDRYLYEKWPGIGALHAAKFQSNPNWVFPNETHDYNQTTLGLQISYRPLENWNTTVVIGQDNNVYSVWQPTPHYIYVEDTLVSKSAYTFGRRSIRLNTSYKQNLEDFSVRLSGGYEYSLVTSTSSSANGIQLNQHGDMILTSQTTTAFNSEDRRTANYSGLLEVGYAERLFGSISLAASEDPRGHSKVQNTPPRYGLTYSTDVGPFEIRVRGQYGGGLLPLEPNFVTPPADWSSVFGGGAFYINSFDLRPERRVGWDAGFDLRWDHYASISITRYDELGTDLIALVLVGGVFGDLSDPQLLQYQNVGDNKVVGWELSSRLNFGFAGLDLLTLRTNYAYSDNRMVKSNRPPSPHTPFLPGDRVANVPAHSGGGALEMNFGKTNASLNWLFSGAALNLDWVAVNNFLYGGAVHRDLGKTRDELGINYRTTAGGVFGTVNRTFLPTRSYYVWYPMYIKFSLRAEHEVYDGVRVFLNVSNLFNDTSADLNSTNVTRGRVTTIGLRVRY